MTTEKIEAQVTGIMTKLHSKEVKMLHEIACGLNSDGVPCPYQSGLWTARKIVTAIAESTHRAASPLHTAIIDCLQS